MFEDALEWEAIKAEMYLEACEVIQNNLKKGVWITKDNRELKLSEMSENHIKNVINFLIENGIEVPNNLKKEYRKKHRRSLKAIKRGHFIVP